jgi:hypothetical protein
MAALPIVRMTLYKHGVGFFERRAKLEGTEVELSYRVREMNDILKSLTAIDWGEGQVLGIDYPTPQDREEQLSGCSVRLADDRSLRDLLVSLRGRAVRLLLEQGEETAGSLLGLDEVAERQPLGTSLVSLLVTGTDQVQTVPLARIEGVQIEDGRAASDLRFFLRTALTQEEYRQVVVRLTPGAHDLSISYVAPTPTWRVSYRLVAEGAGEGRGDALLQGWGIFDNRLDEDLEGISLSLVAGMPISFVYDLYNPYLPARPVVEEEARVAPAPVEFAEAAPAPSPVDKMVDLAAARPAMARARERPTARAMASREALAQASPVATSGQALGELFEYRIQTPVTVERGHSAMVPILSSDLPYRKDLLYNGAKMPGHPVATLRFKNATGLTLERGPVTVMDGGEYVGEAILPFTPSEGEVTVPYAVELGARVGEEAGSSRHVRGLAIEGAYLRFEEWDIRWREYQINNRTAQALGVLIEHPRTAHYSLFDTPEPQERTDEHLRFQVAIQAHSEATLRVQERRLVSRREELRRQSYENLQRFLRQGLLDSEVYEQLAQLLHLWEQIGDLEQRLQQIEQKRQQIYRSQQQIQGNMGALSTTGKEGALRARYVEQLETSEEQLQALASEEAEKNEEIERLKSESEARIKDLE